MTTAAVTLPRGIKHHGQVRSYTARHRHPDYQQDPAKHKCGLTITVLEYEDGKVKFQRDGKIRRKCPCCKKALKAKDLR
jgi:hypothetical protein